MPDVALLQPDVLRGVIQKMQAPTDHLGARIVPRSSYPFPTWKYDVVKGGRNLAKPNTPNAEANIVKQLTVGQVAGSFLYIREKKVLEATTLYWLRAEGTTDTLKRAETKVLEELRDLNLRTERFVEWTIWQMFSGTLTLNSNGVVATIDYLIAGSHKPTAAVAWSNTATADVENDIVTWKRLIARDGFTTATTLIANDVTVRYILANERIRADLFSNEMKAQFMNTGQFTGLFNLTIVTYDLGYVDDVGTEQRFIPDNKVFIYSPANTPCEMLEGPTADTQAPQGFTGKFSKSWEQEDSSARQILVEYTFMPTLPRPEQVVYANV